MNKKSHEEIDELFGQLRLKLVQLRQLEDCVESLVTDSLRLASLEGKQKTPKEKPSKT